MFSKFFRQKSDSKSIALDRAEAIEQLADSIAAIELPHTVRVGIDGVDASGKTTLADELVVPLKERGRPVIRSSTDRFHRPRADRHRRGTDSPEGFYLDSFDNDSMRDELLDQIGPGGSGKYRTTIYDQETETFVYEELSTAQAGSVLLFDGIFLMRPELADAWDFSIFVRVDFDETLRRATVRDLERFGSAEAVEARYRTRYIPGQQIYLKSAQPETKADIAFDNSDVARPVVIWR